MQDLYKQQYVKFSGASYRKSDLGVHSKTRIIKKPLTLNAIIQVSIIWSRLRPAPSLIAEQADLSAT